MNRQFLDALIAAGRESRSVALATELANGRQLLVDGASSEGELELDTAALEAVRQVLSSDRNTTLETPGGRVFVEVFSPPRRCFVVGAVHSGLGMVLVGMYVLRRLYHLEAHIELAHFDKMGKLLVVTTLTLAYLYFADQLTVWYGRIPDHTAVMYAMLTGPFAPAWWPMMAIATSSREITASCVTHSYSDSGYRGRKPVPSESTVQVRWGAA